MRGTAVPGGPGHATKAADAAVACPPLEGIDLSRSRKVVIPPPLSVVQQPSMPAMRTGSDDLPIPHPHGSPVRSQSASFTVAGAAGAMACAGAPGACRAR